MLYLVLHGQFVERGVQEGVMIVLVIVLGICNDYDERQIIYIVKVGPKYQVRSYS